MHKENRIVKASLMVLFVIVLAKLFALAEDAAVASLIGTSAMADDYYMSADILQLFWYFGTLGIIRVFLPEYKRRLTLYGESAAESYSASITTLFTLFSLAITAVLFVFAGTLSGWMAYGFNEQDRLMTACYVRWRTPQIVFWCWTSLLTAKLQSRGKFLISKVPEVLVHLPVIVLSLLFFPRFGVDSLFWGLILGSILGFLSQLFPAGGLRSLRPGFSFSDEGVRDSLRRMPAAFVSAALTQINSVVDKVMASSQPAGAVSGLTYGHRMFTAVHGLISGAVSTVVYPKITEYAALDDKKRLCELLQNILTLLLFLIIPFSMGMALFSSEITEILFQRGAFDEASVGKVAVIFSAYAPGLGFAGINSIIQLVYFAYGNTKVPMLTSLLSITCNVLLNAVFVSFMGARGIALASSVAALAACVGLLVKIKQYVYFLQRKFVGGILRILLFSAAACGAAFLFVRTLLPAGGGLLRLLAALLIGAAIYLPLVYVFDRRIFFLMKTL